MRRKDDTFEQDIQCIIEPREGRGGIFISNLEAASNPDTLLKHRIGAVITAAKGNNLAQRMPAHIEYLYIPAIDSESFDISQYFETAGTLLEQELPRTNVLVHCMAGVSRSATLVIAYLMRSRSLSFSQAFRLVKSKRKIISPNSAFIQQLQKYQIELQQKTGNKFKNQNESTTTSWYSPAKPSLSVQPKIDEQQYDRQLRHRIKLLLARVKS